MKNRYLELVAFLSLITYLALVAAGQALHSIPGCGCHHYLKTSNSDASFNTPSNPHENICEVLFKSRSNRRTEESPNGCLVCHWFSMAQQPILATTSAYDSAAARLAVRIKSTLRGFVSFNILPRGPPVR